MEQKNIENFEGIYQITNFGNVISLKRKGVTCEKILKPVADRNGYLSVCLRKNTKSYSNCIHGKYKTHNNFIWKISN